MDGIQQKIKRLMGYLIVLKQVFAVKSTFLAKTFIYNFTFQKEIILF